MTPRTTAAPAASPPPTAPPDPASADASAPLGLLTDGALVDAAIGCQVAENAAKAGRLAAILEFRARQETLDAQRSPAAPSFFKLTPTQATTAEFAPGLAVTDRYVEIGLDIATRLSTLFPGLWAMCRSGRMDLNRAEVLLDTVAKFANPDDIATFAAEMDKFIAKYDDPDSPLCTVSRYQLQRAAWNRKRKYPQQSEEESFAAAFQKRRVTLRPGDDGIGSLGIRTALPDVMTVDYRLTLIAKQIQMATPTRPAPWSSCASTRPSTCSSASSKSARPTPASRPPSTPTATTMTSPPTATGRRG